MALGPRPRTVVIPGVIVLVYLISIPVLVTRRSPAKAVVAAGLLLLAGCAARPAGTESARKQQGIVRGTVAYRERLALPPDAVVEVWLRDVTPGLVMAQVLLGEATVRSEGRQVPIAFELRYDAARIDPAHDYAVKAVIQSAGRTLFESPADHPVITKGHPTEVALWLVRPMPDLQGTAWRLEDLGGTPVLDGAEATLEFTEAGPVLRQGRDLGRFDQARSARVDADGVRRPGDGSGGGVSSRACRCRTLRARGNHAPDLLQGRGEAAAVLREVAIRLEGTRLDTAQTASILEAQFPEARFLAACRGVGDVAFGLETGRREYVGTGLRALALSLGRV